MITVNKLQYPVLLGGGGESLTRRIHLNTLAGRGGPTTTGAHEVTTIDELQLGGGEGGRTLNDSQVSCEIYVTS